MNETLLLNEVKRYIKLLEDSYSINVKYNTSYINNKLHIDINIYDNSFNLIDKNNSNVESGLNYIIGFYMAIKFMNEVFNSESYYY